MRTSFRLVLALGLCPGSALVVQADPFAAGATWTGQRVFDGKGKQDWSLTVTGRKGELFKGEMVLQGKDGPVTFSVKGKASADRPGEVAFHSEQKEKFQQSFKGTYANGKLSLTFTGTTAGGVFVSGTATLAAAPVAPAPAPATGPLTADEKTLLALASRAGCYYGNAPTPETVITPPAMTREEKARLLANQFRAGGRGKRVATGLYARDVLTDLLNAETARFDAIYASFPAAMRAMAWRTTGLALQGKDIPAPFTADFRAFAAPGLGWADDIRTSQIKQKILILHRERSYFQTVVAVEQDLVPLYKSPNVLPRELFTLQIFPGGQSLRVRYTGKEPLTNVALLSLVKQDPLGPKNTSQIPPAAIDYFNRTFGATEREATEAMTYIQAADAHARMPKYGLLYLPELKPNDEVFFEVGYMERGKALLGNTNTFAVYSDQGVLQASDLSGFPLVPLPRR